MKNFSLKYFLSKEDYKRYYHLLNAALSNKRLKVTLIILSVSLVFVLLGLFSLGVTVFFVSMTTFFLMDLVDGIYTNKLIYKSKLSGYPYSVDFYNDHMEIFIEGDEKFKVKSENHYPLSSVKMVFETDLDFYLNFEDGFLLIIPKFKINEENETKIKNLIVNLYEDRYLEKP